jgi:hypothetical protein
MSNTIYDQHDKAFANVSAFIVMNGNERVATIAFKFPKDGAGRLSCFLHVLGLPMVKGNAGGYGYDKKSAAFRDAAEKQCQVKLESWQTSDYAAEYAVAAKIRDCLNNGHSFNDDLREAGFTVYQAV